MKQHAPYEVIYMNISRNACIRNVAVDLPARSWWFPPKRKALIKRVGDAYWLNIKADLKKLDEREIIIRLPKREMQEGDFDTAVEFEVARATGWPKPFESRSFILRKYGRLFKDHDREMILEAEAIRYSVRIYIKYMDSNTISEIIREIPMELRYGGWWRRQ